MIEDKTQADTDLSHDLIVREGGISLRYVKLSEIRVPYGQQPCVSGLRVFGLGKGERPAVSEFSAVRTGDLDMEVTIPEQKNTVGYNILFGSAPEKLYHSCMAFSPGVHRIGALVKGRKVFVRVDTFNENGITEGSCIELR